MTATTMPREKVHQIVSSLTRGRTISFRVHGTPAPMGSKRHVGNGKMIESSKAVKPWRQDVASAAVDALPPEGWTPMDGPLGLHVMFIFPRPASHYGTGRNAALLKPSAPAYKQSAPDLSKLVRSTEDALTDAGVWRDDARVAHILAEKTYGDSPGAVITIRSLT